MGSYSRVAAVAWSLATLAGCSAIAGLDSIQEQTCAPDCDAGLPDGAGDDATSPTESGPDSSWTDSGSPGDSSVQDVWPGDGPTPGDSGMLQDAGQDVAFDVATETGPRDSSMVDTGVADTGTTMEASPPDSGMADVAQDTSPPVEAGCGPTNTTTNCGACGHSCASASTSTASASCSGTSCSYTCNSGYLDCNASVSYDPDGCECNVTNTNSSAACCSNNACPVQHTDGVSGSGFATTVNFYDCNAVGTYTQSLAMDACTNYVGAGNSGTLCKPETCSPSGSQMICAENFQNTCVCWEYSGTNVGKVAIGNGGSNCLCPNQSGGTTTTWQ